MEKIGHWSFAASPTFLEVCKMRLGFVAPAVLSLFVAVACAGKDDASQVQGGGTAANGNDGSAANGNNGIGGGGLVIGGGTAASGNSTSTAGNGSDPVGPGSECATSAADGEPVPVDLYFMVDTTGSMNCPVPQQGECNGDPGPPKTGDSRWTVVSAALKTFVADPANQDLGVGINFFPSKDDKKICQANAYATPLVEIGPLSTTGPALTTNINMQSPGGQTPTVPSLQAAIQHATAWAKANPTHRVAVVYATDGYPKGCTGNTIPAAAALAKAGFAANPSIPVYVLGVGPNLSDLNTIADSGGTTKAFLVDTTQDAAAQLSAALAAIRGNAALDCTYTIPAPPSGQSLETGKVNVTYTNSAGVVTKVYQDAMGVSCDKGIGWQYSADGKQINLCGSACSAVKADPGGKIQVLFGCMTEVGNPPK
ncbi:MAG: vWA domain-containing protein [Polyangiaceae bacterium]